MTYTPSAPSGRNRTGKGKGSTSPQANPWATPPPQPLPSGEMSQNSYINAPPGDATRAFMSTAGIYRARRMKWFVGTTLSVLVAALAALVAADVAGAIEIPGMGIVYDMTGLEDPSVDRAIARVQEQLTDHSLSSKERDALRDRLLGLSRRAAVEQGPVRDPAAPTRRAKRRGAAASTVGIREAAPRGASETALIADVFGDARKKEATVKLADRSQIRAPNLPDGLTQEAIHAVIEENKGAMSLCIAEAMRKGEKLDGRMEVALTINAHGVVSGARIDAARFRGTVMGECTVRRARGWRFPRFNGEPVTVVFPYVLSAGF